MPIYLFFSTALTIEKKSIASLTYTNICHVFVLLPGVAMPKRIILTCKLILV